MLTRLVGYYINQWVDELVLVFLSSFVVGKQASPLSITVSFGPMKSMNNLLISKKKVSSNTRQCYFILCYIIRHIN